MITSTATSSTQLKGAPTLSVVRSPARLRDFVQTARPRQWTKNALVFAAPGATGMLIHGSTLARAFAAAGVFCLAATGTYFLNDAIDAAADRLHPTKRHRPIAAGRISRLQGLIGAFACLVPSLALSALVRPQLAAVTGAYIAVTVTYTLWLKHEAILDIVAVAAGFVLRVIAGAVATGTHASAWLLLVVLFGALFMVSGRRYAEQLELGAGASGHRMTLGQYSLVYLRSVRSISTSVMIVGYCLWVGSMHSAGDGAVWLKISVLPLVLAILHYSLIVEGGGGGAPEEVVLKDRPLQVLGLAWCALCVLGLYGH